MSLFLIEGKKFFNDVCDERYEIKKTIEDCIQIVRKWSHQGYIIRVKEDGKWQEMKGLDE